MRRALILSSLAALSLVAAGLGGSSAFAASTKSAPQKGGTVVYGLPAQVSPNWFFPELSLNADSTVNSELTELTYMPLVYFGPNNQLSQAYGLASSVSYNKAGTVFTVHINPKWRWSNGTPVTAQDVVFTYDIMKAGSGSVTYAWAYAGQGSGGMPYDWKSVVAKGKDTVVITTTKPVNQQWFIRNGIGQIVPVPKSVWDKYPTNTKAEMKYINSVANSPTNPVYQVVDGPWRIQSSSPNLNWTYAANTHFDGKQPYINKLIFQYETSDAAEFEGLKTGTINYGYLPASMAKDTSLLPDDRVAAQYSLGFNYIQLNMNPKAPGGIAKAFDQLPVREALQMGVNEPGIIKTIWKGYGAMDDTTLATEPPNPFLDPALSKPPYPYNPTKGREILEKAGWKMVHGVMTKGNLKLEFALNAASGSASYTDIDQLLEQDWAKEGIKVNLVFQPFDTVISYSPADASKWAALNWNGGWGYGTGYPSGGVLFETGAAENSGSYSSAEMNKLINATYQPASYQESLKHMYAYEEYAAKQLPAVIYLPEQPSLTVVSDNLHNAIKTFNPIGGWVFPNEWWLSH
jgi:peptide/nickel transport system substrate-binding protein